MNPLCRNCKWWDAKELSDRSEDAWQVQDCKVNAPIIPLVVITTDVNHRPASASWPKTGPKDFCGRFEPHNS